MSILIVFLLAWNFGISWLNCYFVGKTWAESKVMGGWVRFVTWCAAVMGACGFIWCNLLVIGYIASTHVGILPVKYQLTDTYLELLWNIGYVLIIFPILGSGMGIWIDSLKRAYHERTAGNIGVAGYNTFAQVYNTFEAARFLPSVFKAIGKTLDSAKTIQGKGMLLVVYACLTLSIGGGLGLAYYIIHSTAVRVAQDARIASLEAQVGKSVDAAMSGRGMPGRRIQN